MLAIFQQNTFITTYNMLFNNIKKSIISSIALAVLAISTVSLSSKAATGDIVDVASKASQFSTLVAAVTAADLVTTLQGAGPFTVLAPTNAAFAALPADVLAKLLLPINKPELQKILKYHVVSGSSNATVLTAVATSATPTVVSVEGSKLNLSVAGAVLKINTDTAVTAADIAATNGIVHQIDKVLLPPTFSLTDLKEAPVAVTKNIVQLASETKDLSTLVAAVKAAGLVDTLSAVGPYTVLAPTNAAFAKIPADVLEKLLLPANKAILVKILTYHVLAGKNLGADVAKLTTVKTVEGSNLSIMVNGAKITFDKTSNVITPDIMATNGVVHTIDSVLIPSSVDLSKLIGKAPGTARTGSNDQIIISIGVLSIIALFWVSKMRLVR
jgi:transforming growth factor-beta-induced protein